MHTMYSNLAKNQAFPIVIRFSSQTSKTQLFPIGYSPKPSLNPSLMYSTHKGLHFHHKARSFSSWNSKRVGEDRVFNKAGKAFPWLASGEVNRGKGSHKVVIAKTDSRSSWEESLDRLEKENNSSSSWEESNESFLGKRGGKDFKESRHRKVDMIRDRRNGLNGSHGKRDESNKEEEVREEDELVNDPRWDKIKGRFRGMVDREFGSEKPEFRRWNKQESWGRKTWKEATESTLPKMVGEGVYGVGPVLAALSAGRREFYVCMSKKD
ncbi:hypothetical protein J1N35_003297 [Gossypium stocksii]|uniref:Uncharacterized protein n=1 Tax=Gossypium stocksii TaxID=47602 RepID=A0A9D3WMV7_9ROSI|nr:hypothetical protein J1N35_003297 [Gossypium stocksii]